MTDFHFLRPYYLFLFIPLIALLIVFIKRKRGTGVWQACCEKELLPYILEKKIGTNSPLYIPLFVASTLLVAALAGPAWNQAEQPLIKTESALVILLDLSPAMSADDIKPSRLQRAIYKINDLLDGRKEGETALIAFSGEPFVVTPLTDDVENIRILLPALDPKIMPTIGQEVHLAIEKGGELLKQGGMTHGHLLLISSELTLSDLEKSTAIASKNGASVSVLAVGSEAPTPIPDGKGGLIKNSQGALITTTLAKENLARLASSTGGSYVLLRSDDADIENLTATFASSPLDHETTLKEWTQVKWQDEGYYLILAALPFVAFLFRRGIIFSLLFFFLPLSLQADLWQTKDRKGEELYHQENYQEAKELFDNPDWKAAACYKSGDYEDAAKLFEGNSSPDGFYNCGNAKAKMGDLKGAIEAYDKTLELDPTHEDALFNKNLVEEELKKQEKEKQEQKQEESDQKKEGDKDQDQSQDQNQDNGNESKESKNQQEQNKQNGDQKEEDSSQNGEEEKKEGEQEKKEHSQSQEKEEQNEKEEQKGERKTEDEKAFEDLKKQFSEEIDKEKKEQEERPKPEEAKEQKASPEAEDPQSHVDDMWLRRIDDDRAGLLRRKFLQQYQQRNQNKGHQSK